VVFTLVSTLSKLREDNFFTLNFRDNEIETKEKRVSELEDVLADYGNNIEVQIHIIFDVLSLESSY